MSLATAPSPPPPAPQPERHKTFFMSVTALHVVSLVVLVLALLDPVPFDLGWSLIDVKLGSVNTTAATAVNATLAGGNATALAPSIGNASAVVANATVAFANATAGGKEPNTTTLASTGDAGTSSAVPTQAATLLPLRKRHGENGKRSRRVGEVTRQRRHKTKDENVVRFPQDTTS
ncbi:hypothetical protein ACQY0O_004945 [Thecaphora frezii]